MQVLRFCTLIALISFAFIKVVSVEAIAYVQMGVVGAGYNSNGTCFIDYFITGMGTNNDSNTPEKFDYFAVIEWVQYPEGVYPVAASMQTAIKGQFFDIPYALNLIGNNELYPVTLSVYELGQYPAGPLTMQQLVAYILNNSLGEVSAEIFPGDYFVGTCPAY